MMYQLYGQFANRYDIHTPPNQHRHDHAFIISECLQNASHPSLLDVGCGTGVLVQKAREAGIAAFGIDPSAAMIEICRRKLGTELFQQCGIEDYRSDHQFDCVTSLGWSLNYCKTQEAFLRALVQIHGLLRSSGVFIAEIPNAAAARGILVEERKSGPDGLLDDVMFLFRFESLVEGGSRLLAQYVYSCKSRNELLFEEHVLGTADPTLVAQLCIRAGFTDVAIYNSHRRDLFVDSISPFIVARVA